MAIAVSGFHFVIDGAHRLSALIAWVHDDYGDGKISRPFFSQTIPRLQERYANQVRQLVKGEVGSYQDLQFILKNPRNATNAQALRARNLSRKIPLQWVNGPVSKAEESFFNINGNPAIIDQSELGILKARKKPNAIAMRAIIRGATGHKYWDKFDQGQKDKIEELAVGIHGLLFAPISESETITRTLEVPPAGTSYRPDTFKMVFDAVNMVNGITDSMWRADAKTSRKPTAEQLQDDADGSKTVLFLEKFREQASLISGTDTENKSSLALHPIVYFYGSTGKSLPFAYLAVLKFCNKLKNENRLFEFTGIREDFEAFLLAHKDFVNQLGHSKGSRMRPVESLVTMYQILFDQLAAGTKDHESIVEMMVSSQQLRALVIRPDEEKAGENRNFSRNVKNASFIEAALSAALKCGVCHGYLVLDKMSADHIVRKEDGGIGTGGNLQWLHPYCNHGYKEKIQSVYNQEDN